MIPLYKVKTVYKCKKLIENSRLSTLITEFATYFPAAETTFEKKYFIPLRQLKLLIAQILDRVAYKQKELSRTMQFLNGDAWFVSMPYTIGRGRGIVVTSKYSSKIRGWLRQENCRLLTLTFNPTTHYRFRNHHSKSPWSQQRR